jgi:hypothetical protein
VKLTDEFVADLVEHEDDVVKHALALEVQSSRAKRCEACLRWRPTSGAVGTCDWIGEAAVTTATWYCADFSTKV